MIDMIYIASPSFSGSTLLTFMLNNHPDIATMGELKWGDIDLDTYQCSCEARLVECPFWLEVARRVKDRELPFSFERPMTDFRCRSHPLPDRIARARIRGLAFETTRNLLLKTISYTREAFATARELNRAMTEIILDLQGGKVFCDASKDPVRLKHLIDTGDYRIKTLHLFRDGRAVMNSAKKNASHSAEKGIQEWLRTHEQIELLKQRNEPDSFMVVRYEELCDQPAQTIKHICEFAGLDTVDYVPDYRAAEHHILGNRMRLKPTSQIKLDLKWKMMLTEDDLRLFEQFGGDCNRRHGYE